MQTPANLTDKKSTTDINDIKAMHAHRIPYIETSDKTLDEVRMTMGRNFSAIVAVLACLVSLATAVEIKSTNTSKSHHIPLIDGICGAESIAFYGRDAIYTGVSDGRIFKWSGNAAGWSSFAYGPNYRKIPRCSDSTVLSEEKEDVCGRPLGVQFYRKTGELYIADAYLGLMKVGAKGGETQLLANEANGVPFHYLNGLDVDQATGDVYFTDSSLNYTRRSTINIMKSRDTTGRLLKYDAQTKHVSVLKTDLPYPNGVAVSRDGTHVVVAHTRPSKVFRYWLKGPKAGQYELFADLPGYPDNVRRDEHGGFWVALNREKVRIDPTAPAQALTKHLVGVRLDADGVEVEELTAAKEVTLSEVGERNGKLWLGSVELDYVGVLSY